MTGLDGPPRPTTHPPPAADRGGPSATLTTPHAPPRPAAGRGGRSATVTRPHDHPRPTAGRGGRSATVTRPPTHPLPRCHPLLDTGAAVATLAPHRRASRDGP